MNDTGNGVTQEVVETQEESYKSGAVRYIDSREVAKMVEKDHDKLCRDIRRYTSQLDAANFGDISAFWTESTYADAYERTQKCYLVTKKGCEFIAHKLTGIKGTKFTATYINRFHKMEDALDAQIIPALQQFMEQQMEAIMERLEKLEEAKSRCQENPYGTLEESGIESRKKEIYELTSKVAELCGNSQTKILHYMYRTLEEDLGIVLDSYKAVYRSETGRRDANMVEVIAANDNLYEKAVEMNRGVIERKRIYG